MNNKNPGGLILILSFLFFQNCSSNDLDDTSSSPNEIEAEAATNILVSDRGNTSNASDIYVEFSTSANDGITEYRIYIGEEGSFENFTINDFKNISSTSYHKISKSGTSIQSFLNESQTDILDSPIEENKAYQVIIYSVADGNMANIDNLSDASEVFTLTKQDEVITIAPNLPANDALVMDKKGNIFASNFGTWSATGGSGSKIIKIDINGVVNDYATGLKGPLAMHYSESNGLLVIDDNNGSRGNIVKILPNNQKEQIASISGWPGGIAEDDDGNLYISNFANATLRKINPDKTTELISTDSRLKGTVGIIYHSNKLYIGNYNNGKILISDLVGNISEFAQLSVVSGFGLGYITILGDNLYGTGIGNHFIFKVPLSSGKAEIWAGNGNKKRTDGLIEFASFFNPNGIVADKENNRLYVLDWGSPALRQIQLY